MFADALEKSRILLTVPAIPVGLGKSVNFLAY